MFNLKSLFKQEKAVWDRIGYSYRWDTFWIWESIETNMDLYYKLYRENTDLRRCIEELYQTTGKDWYNFKKGEIILNNTILYNALNFENWFNVFKSLIIRDLNICWNVFILPIKNAGSKTIWFQVLDPRTIRIIANKYWEVVRYLQVRWWRQQEFMPDELFHFKDSIDHDNEVFWISKVETLVYDMLADKESWRSNYSFFKNNGIPSTLITLDNELDEEEIRIALAQLKKQFSWWDNKHRVSASTGIKDVKVLWNSMKDMEFVTLRWFTTERICSAMWVPKTILWYSDNINFSTSDNQYRKYIENTIIPLTQTLENILNTLIKSIDESITLEFIKDNSYNITEQVNRYEKLINLWVMTINEVRAELWLELFTTDNADEPIIKSWYTLVQDIWVDNIQDETIPDNQI